MPPVIALVDDLLFASRIREAARGAGVDVLTLRRSEDVVAALRVGSPLLLVDADSDRLPWAETIASVRSEASLAAVPIVAFFSHVHADRAVAARAAGASRTLARSAFVQELPRLLAAAASPSEEKTP
jgi:DNA-binding response OmpR family regulator